MEWAELIERNRALQEQARAMCELAQGTIARAAAAVQDTMRTRIVLELQRQTERDRNGTA
jgi:hypothetical protein